MIGTSEEDSESTDGDIAQVEHAYQMVPLSSHEPSNENIIRQCCSFYSTKKRRRKALVRIVKPNTGREQRDLFSRS